MPDSTNILFEIIFILLQGCLFLFNYQVSKKDLFYPPVLFSLVWLVIPILHLVFSFTVLDKLYPMHLETFVTFFIGTICFSLGGILLTAIRQEIIDPERIIAVPAHTLFIDRRLRLLLLAILILGLPLYIQAAFRLFVASQIDNFFVGLRTEINYGDEDIGPTKYLISFSFVAFGINYYSFLKERGKLNLYMVWMSLLLAVTYAVFATGRTYYFVVLSVFLGISYLLKKNFSIKKYAWALLIFTCLFMGVGMIYGSIEESDGSVKGNLSASVESTAIYLVSSLPALDIELKNHVEASYPGENTLLFFIKIGRKLGWLANTKQASLISEYVSVPYPTNVYSVYSPYIKDFGKWFAWMMLFLLAMLHTWVYHKAKELKNLRFTIYYAFLVFPLLMSFFIDQYLSLFSTWIQVIVEVELILLINYFFIRYRRQV